MDTQDEKIRIGKEIASLRAKRGMTIRELSEKTGIYISNLSNIETGKTSTGVDTLSKIADALGARVDITEIKGI